MTLGRSIRRFLITMPPWLRYLIAFVVACHGFTYIPFGILMPDTLEEWRGRSRIVGSALSGKRPKALLRVLHGVVGIAIFACAVAVPLVPSVPGLWRPFAVTGATLGIAAFALFWDGQARLLAQEGLIGAVLSLILLVIGIAFPGVFG
jgi:hypothetical protein